MNRSLSLEKYALKAIINIGSLKLCVYFQPNFIIDISYAKFIESIFNISNYLTPRLELNIYFRESNVNSIIQSFDLAPINELIPAEIQPIFDEMLLQKLDLKKDDFNWVKYYKKGEERFIYVTSMNIIYRFIPNEYNIFIYSDRFSWSIILEIIQDLILTFLRGFLILHASTISGNNSLMSFSGKSRSGKTSISLSYVGNNLHYIICDDITILDKHFKIIPYREDIKIPVSYIKKYPELLHLHKGPKYISGKNKYVMLLPKSYNQNKNEAVNRFFVLTQEKNTCEIVPLDTDKLQVLIRNKSLFPALFSQAFWCLPFLGNESSYILKYIEEGLGLYEKFISRKEIYLVRWDYSRIKDVKKYLMNLD
ncbi:MAG: hypothetical protein PHS80_01695 [Methanothrix sp.]|nr:hypothetical protein [Methanothrix sp.]MDD4446221.1 hypothetical protein [Methanothrix sp.]